jgi:hypothetical protein
MRLYYKVCLISHDKDIVELEDSVTIPLAENEAMVHQTPNKIETILNSLLLDPTRIAVNEHIRDLKLQVRKAKKAEDKEEIFDVVPDLPALPPIPAPGMENEEADEINPLDDEESYEEDNS